MLVVNICIQQMHGLNGITCKENTAAARTVPLWRGAAGGTGLTGGSERGLEGVGTATVGSKDGVMLLLSNRFHTPIPVTSFSCYINKHECISFA